MRLSKDRISLYEVARKIFEEATTAALGSTCNTVITFHLEKRFGRDPCEVFVEDPRAFYVALEEIFGAGADSIVSLVGSYLVRKYGISYTPERFVSFVVTGDESSRHKLKEILSRVANQTEN